MLRLSLIGCILIDCLAAQATFKDQQNQFPNVMQARLNRAAAIESLYAASGIADPPRGLVLVAYKQERVLEVWGRRDSSIAYTLVRIHPFTAYSGTLGPKRRRGDGQIPEGFYVISRFYPVSPFHLALLVSYPNASDRVLAGGLDLGGDICIHGNRVTIGCIPIGDAGIEELYTMCVDQRSSGREIPVYIFPCRMDSSAMAELRSLAADNVELYAFWENLRQGYDRFVNSFQRLKYWVDEKGRYVFY
jgi:murein L,D-transpeptidase YafK